MKMNPPAIATFFMKMDLHVWIGEPKLGIVVDAFHISIRGWAAGNLNSIPVERIYLVQLCDLDHEADFWPVRSLGIAAYCPARDTFRSGRFSTSCKTPTTQARSDSGSSMTMSRRRSGTRSRDKRSQRCGVWIGLALIGRGVVRRIYRLLSGAYTDLNLTGWKRLCISMPNVEKVGILPRL
jgi:hypothetical protein